MQDTEQDTEEFEVFTRRSTPIIKDHYIAIHKRGTISLNRSAVEALGEPHAVQLLFNRTKRIVAFRPTDPKTESAYPLRRQNNSNSWLIAGQAFLNFYDIEHNITRRYRGEFRDNMLRIDLSQGGTEVVGRRAGTQQEKLG
jgi:hypothetical protein